MARAKAKEHGTPIAEAAKLLKKEGASPTAIALVADLFAGVDAEDLTYDATQFAAFARSAAETLAFRAPGKAVISVHPGPANDGEPLTVVEIANDNMAFLVDSTLGEVREAGHDVLLVAHPIVSVGRNPDGKLRSYGGISHAATDEGRESLIQIHLPALTEEEMEDLAAALARVHEQVRFAVTDWKRMLGDVEAAIIEYETQPPPFDREEVEEAIAFLRWLVAGNFTFLGLRHYDFVGGEKTGTLRRREETGMGVLSESAVRVLRRRRLSINALALRDVLLQPEPLIVTKSNLRSHIHRRTHMDYVGIKRYSARGRLVGETRVVGLLTSASYHLSVREIPYIRRKVAWVEEQAGFDPTSHSGKALLNVLESYPREELFRIDREMLLQFALDILRLEDRPRPRALIRRDRFDRFLSVLVFVPRDHYDSDVRLRIGEFLAGRFNGRVSYFEPTFLEGALVRVHFIIGRDEGEAPNPDREEIEEGIRAIVRTWNDAFLDELKLGDGEEAGHLYARYAHSFPESYREDFSPAIARADVDTFEGLSHESPTRAQFYRRSEAGSASLDVKLYNLGPPIELTRRVPVFENFGFRVIAENTYRIDLTPGEPIHVHDMRLETANGAEIDGEAVAPRLIAALEAQWGELADSDGYDALIINADLDWREVAFVRTISRFLRQAGVTFSESYMAATMNRHPTLTAAIIRLFRSMLQPGKQDQAVAEAAEAEITAGLADVPILDEDKIIRLFAGIVRATLRTNFFQPDPDGGPKAEIALKLQSRTIAELPEPKPFREIFMSSPRLQGVHLRFGKIARGGIRWSDRPQDFRTEVLGLVKAQQVKNAVIVPVGAKGGFVPMRLASLPADLRASEGKEVYRIFIRTLLELTDNLEGGKLVPPKDVVRRDEDDPYLVVAADKGTATFSDTANAIALDHDFWLGDAFASGGSAGFDHKAMGITARGAFESVKRHFRELDTDITRTPFTVAGVGDMSGDVFGNGMLLLPTTRLVAAFDHRDIFVDPDPDLAASFAERQRLFALPRSSWQDYDKKLLSRGGGVFSRSQKTIRLSPEIRALLDIPANEVTAAELMRAILQARVDLLWFGGIGTFIRGSAEPDSAIGDRANDPIRIAASEVHAKVIGEGANLGVTDRGRIEFSLAGGLCNSDAIDNSAGVNTSDVEVNIKIAFSEPLRSGKLKLAARNRLLAGMVDDVAKLVLRNNYLQTLAISSVRHRGLEDHPFQLRLMQSLEARGLLDRRLERLPDDAEMAGRANRDMPLTRPEIGLLLAHAKLAFFADILPTELPDDPTLEHALIDYFPASMRKRFAGEIRSHRLRREIIATDLSNRVVNFGGPTFLARMADQAGATPETAARAFLVTNSVFQLDPLLTAIDALDGQVRGAAQLRLYGTVQDLLIRKSVWFIRNVSMADMSALIEEFGAAAKAMRKTVAADAALRESETGEQFRSFVSAGVPETLAQDIASLPLIGAAPGIQLVCRASGKGWDLAAKTYFGVGDLLFIARLEALATALEVSDYYEGMALSHGLRTIGQARRAIAIAALSAKSREPLEAWIEARRPAVETARSTIQKMIAGGTINPSKLAFAAELLSGLASD